MNNRRDFLKTIAAGGVGAATAGLTGCESKSGSADTDIQVKSPLRKKINRPNIIFIISHDTGRELGCYGRPIDTPNINKFARNGVLFTNFYCSSPCCSPSRAGFYSGKYASNNGMMGLSHIGWSYKEGLKTVVDYFNENDYETVHVGLQHEVAFDNPENNRYQVEMRKEWNDEHVNNAVDTAIQYLKDAQGKEKPFYLNIGTAETHKSQWNSKNELWHPIYGETPAKETYMPPYLPDFEDVRYEMGNFQASVRYFDMHLGRLFDAIKELGYNENTVVVYTTDHGIVAGDRGKGKLYQPGVEIAYMMQFPGVFKEGQVISDLGQNIDVAPTLLEMAGIDLPGDYDGQSMLPRLLGEEYTEHDKIFLQRNYHGGYFDPMRAIRTSRYLLIKNFKEGLTRGWYPNEVEDYETYSKGEKPRRNTIELFDVELDPYCVKDLSAEVEYVEMVHVLEKEIDDWMVTIHDPLLKGDIVPPGEAEEGWGFVNGRFQYIGDKTESH